MTDNEPIVKNVEGLQFSIMSPDEINKHLALKLLKMIHMIKMSQLLKVYLI